MNYLQIKKDCPLAWREFEEKTEGVFHDDIYSHTWTDEECNQQFYDFNDRDLYDYFDSVGIIITVVNFDSGFWEFDIEGSVVFNSCDENYKSRTESETAAFTRAFHIRESQLTTSPEKDLKGLK